MWVVVQSLSRVLLFATPWTAAHKAFLSSLSPGVHSNSRSLSQWWQPTISSFAATLFSCPQSSPTSGSFPISLLFTSGSQYYVGLNIHILFKYVVELSEVIYPSFIQKSYLKTKGCRAPWISLHAFDKGKWSGKKRGGCSESQERISNDKIKVFRWGEGGDELGFWDWYIDIID